MDMPLKNMKLEMREDSTEDLLTPNKPRFPYGLRITLDNEVLKKLDLPKLPEVGQMMGIHGVVEVVQVGIDNNNQGSRDKHIELQITDMVLQDKTSDARNNHGEELEENKTILGGGSY